LSRIRKYILDNTQSYGEKVWFVQNPSFFDRFKILSENTKHTFGNNKDLSPDLSGQFFTATYCQGYCFFYKTVFYLYGRFIFRAISWKRGSSRKES
jgi:hypothetical protein